MEWLNYHHLLYFWTVARLGGVSAAAAELKLAQPTVSSQLRQLEESLGSPLFERVSRRMVLTDTGREVFHYADRIFALGREMQDVLRNQGQEGRPRRLVVGVADVVPKQIAHRLLEPALRMSTPIRLVCREDHIERLLGDLSIRNLDLVISDAPPPQEARVRAFPHLLGECGVAFLAAPAVAQGLQSPFPASLHRAPLLLPMETTALRRSLESWFQQQGIAPRVAGEFEDSALLKTFGQAGHGVFAVPSAISTEICQQYHVELVGHTDAIRERFYAITVDRRLRHPAVAAISEAARSELFR